MPYKEFEVFTKKMGHVPKLLELIEETDTEMFETISNLDKVILKDGALSEKHKRLIAMCMAAQQQCDKCVDVCPKDLNPTAAIGRIRSLLVKRRV